MVIRSRQPAQSTVEFGAIAIIFAAMVFAIVDFAILLNGWINVASDARALARDAAVGAPLSSLQAEATSMKVPGVSVDSPTFNAYCCDASAALQLSVSYYADCIGDLNSCSVLTGSTLDSRYGTPPNAGSCTAATCPHPARPRPSGTPTCNPTNPSAAPCPGDLVVVTLTAASAQVVTPLVRPFFCGASTAAHCYVSGISSTVVMRFEGTQL